MPNLTWLSIQDSQLQDETDIMGISPNDLGHFRIEVFRFKNAYQHLSSSEYRAARKKYITASLAPRELPARHVLWDAKKVDEDSFKKDGINCAIG
jgi:hypothetical protein